MTPVGKKKGKNIQDGGEGRRRVERGLEGAIRRPQGDVLTRPMPDEFLTGPRKIEDPETDIRNKGISGLPEPKKSGGTAKPPVIVGKLNQTRSKELYVR